MLFLPIDRKINDNIPYIIYTLLAVNIGVLLYTHFGYDEARIMSIFEVHGAMASKLSPSTCFSHMFLHADPFHLVGNMAFLLLFGMNVERRIGPAMTLVLYLLSGFAALFLFAAVSSKSGVPLVGASGAISGLVGMYLFLFRKREVDVLWYVFVVAGMMRLPAVVISVFWIGLEVLHAILLSSAVQVAHWAHVGGFLGGLLGIAVVMKVIRYRGHPVLYLPPEEQSKMADRFEEINYIPASARPDTAIRRRHGDDARFLVAAHWTDITVSHRKEIDGVAPDAGAFATPACLARGLAPAQADDLRRRLEKAGAAPRILPERCLLDSPAHIFAAGVTASASTLTFRDSIGEIHIVPVTAVFLVSAGRVGPMMVIDVLTSNPWRLYRITEKLAGAAILDLAKAIRAAAPLPATKPFGSWVDEGKIPEPAFSTLGELDVHLQWLAQILAGGRIQPA